MWILYRKKVPCATLARFIQAMLQALVSNFQAAQTQTQTSFGSVFNILWDQKSQKGVFSFSKKKGRCFRRYLEIAAVKYVLRPQVALWYVSPASPLSLCTIVQCVQSHKKTRQLFSFRSSHKNVLVPANCTLWKAKKVSEALRVWIDHSCLYFCSLKIGLVTLAWNQYDALPDLNTILFWESESTLSLKPIQRASCS